MWQGEEKGVWGMQFIDRVSMIQNCLYHESLIAIESIGGECGKEGRKESCQWQEEAFYYLC